MNDFIKELEVAKEISIIVSDESGFNITYTGPIEDVECSDGIVSIFYGSGNEFALFRIPDEQFHDDEGYVFVYGQVTMCFSLLA